MKTQKKSPEEIKQSVKEKYDSISRSKDQDSCCSTGKNNKTEYSIFSDDYSSLEGYNPDADLGLGCGLPTEFARIKPGDTVVDLGSGAGNDAFVARKIAGEKGRVIGIDMTESMVQKATENARKLNFKNVEFIVGDIEEIPLDDFTADVVVSNCVLNLVPDKEKAFAETYRILKSDGHFSISDVVISGDMPSDVREDAEKYAGCVAGAIPKNDYLAIIKKAGFKNINIQKQKEIVLPDDLLSNYLSDEQINMFRNSDTGIYSITVYAEKK